jgi:TonB family protein
MNMSRQIGPTSTFIRFVIKQLSKALSMTGLVTVTAVAGFASGAEIVLMASAPTEAAKYLSAEQKMATIEFFEKYDATARRELQNVARYPNRAEARNQRLEGKVGVAFEVSPSGDLQQVEIIQPSQSKILNSAALASVRWAKYPAFATELPAGEASRRYTVIFDYRFPVDEK